MLLRPSLGFCAGRRRGRVLDRHILDADVVGARDLDPRPAGVTDRDVPDHDSAVAIGVDRGAAGRFDAHELDHLVVASDLYRSGSRQRAVRSSVGRASAATGRSVYGSGPARPTGRCAAVRTACAASFRRCPRSCRLRRPSHLRPAVPPLPVRLSAPLSAAPASGAEGDWADSPSLQATTSSKRSPRRRKQSAFAARNPEFLRVSQAPQSQIYNLSRNSSTSVPPPKGGRI